jgi:hypothetical protein
MEPLILEEQADTPAVILDKDNNTFEIKGCSLPENVFKFYNPVIDWFKVYAEDPNENMELILRFEYLNTSSAKAINNILEILQQTKTQKGTDISIQWFYKEDDPEMKELGEDYDYYFGMPFKFFTYE